MCEKNEKRLKWMSEEFGIPITDLQRIVGLLPMVDKKAIEKAWSELNKTERRSGQEIAAIDKLQELYSKEYEPNQQFGKVIQYDSLESMPVRIVNHRMLAIVNEVAPMDVREVWLKYGSNGIPKTCTSQMCLCKSHILINCAKICSNGSDAQNAALKAIYELDFIG